MNINKSIGLLLAFFALLLPACDKDEPEPPEVKNLVVSIEVDTDGSGHVTIDAEAENVKFYKFFLGEEANETPITTTVGLVSHTYEASGNYTIKVQAHSSESVFLSQTETIEVNIFIPIPETGSTSPTSYSGMTLVWSDEFEGTTIDESDWTFEIGNNNGWGNNELQYYRKENASIVEGHLMIEAKAEAFGGKNYTSTRMITKGKFDFKYGRVDIRAALPKGQGIWPALWMLGANIDAVNWPKCGEIDIMEMIGGTAEREKTTFGTLHWDNAGSHACTCDKPGHILTTGTLNDRFHVFSITWDETFITWYVDGVQFNQIDITPEELSEFHEKYFFIFNVAVGGNWPGNPDVNTMFPQRMFVDYVRVFQPE